MKIKTAIAVVSACGMTAVAPANAASPQIISAQVGDERAIQITWESESNAVYRIDFASQLVNSNTQWRTLYEDYPSHGTSTFWMDTGDYIQEPPVPHPKKGTMRFLSNCQYWDQHWAGAIRPNHFAHEQ
jgi:hypothetical protein